MGEINILGHDGDLKVMWDAEKDEEVRAARRQFDDLTKKEGYIAFSVKKNGERNEKIHEFDPELEKIILSPMLKGG